MNHHRQKQLTSRFFTFAAAALLYLSLTTPATSAGTSVLLLNPDLKTQAVQLQSLDNQTIVFFDADRSLRTEPADNYLQITIQHDADTARTPSANPRIQLTDGQCFTGRYVPDDDGDETFQWNHPYLDTLTLTLDQLQSMILADNVSTPVNPPRHFDRVILHNGDTIDGFVMAITTDSVELQQSDTNSALFLPLNTIAAVYLTSTAPPAPTSDSHTLTLTDGSIIYADHLSITQDKITFKPAGKSLDSTSEVTIPLENLQQISLASSRGRLVYLTSLPMTVNTPSIVFGVDHPPRILNHNLHLHAPVEVTFNLPPNARQFSAAAELDSTAQSRSRTMKWADMILSISCDENMLKTCEINADHPTQNINIELKGTKLSFKIDPAANGPIMDRLLLRDAIVFIAH